LTAAIAAGVISALIVSEFTDACPWLADKLVRWSARRRYPSNPARAEARAEELAAVIRARPGRMLKLFTAVAFTAVAFARNPGWSRAAIPADAAGVAFRHALTEVVVRTGDEVELTYGVTAHLRECGRCRWALRLRHPVLMLARPGYVIDSASSGGEWTFVCDGDNGQLIKNRT
jgi:hypothetical protein